MLGFSAWPPWALRVEGFGREVRGHQSREEVLWGSGLPQVYMGNRIKFQAWFITI